MRCYNFADALTCRSTCVNRTAYRGDVATYDCSHETGVDLFPTDEANVRGFHHRVGSFNHRHQAATFNHSECFWHSGTIVTKKCRNKAQKAQKIWAN